MRDQLTRPASETSQASIDPIAKGRQSLKTPLRERFYKTAAAAPHEDGFVVMLDGRPARTPARARLLLPTRAAAEAIADEWQAQGDAVDPGTMPLTRIANAAIDGVARAMEPVAAEIVKYAGSDLVCYRAGEPASLVEAQAAAWDPVLAFAETEIGARFLCAEGIVHVEQPESSIAAVRAAVDRLARIGAGAPLALACLDVMTGLTGSALIALALASGAMPLDAAWAAAHVDEDFQRRLWGADHAAMARRAGRFTEMAAAERLWRLVRA